MSFCYTVIYSGYQSFDILIANMFPELIDFYVLAVFQSIVVILFSVQKVLFFLFFSNFILKYKQDSLGLCQHNSLMYFCFQIPNMKVRNTRLETADI